MIVEELVAKIGINFTGAGDIAKAGSALKTFQNLAFGASGILTGIATAFGGITLGVANSVAEMGDFGKAVGASVQTLQTLTYAAEQNGGSFEDVRLGLKTLADQAGNAAAGNEESAKSFARLGVSVRDAAGHLKTADTLSADVAEGLSKIKDPATQLNVATNLLGRGAIKLLPALQDGAQGLADFRAEAERIGYVLDQNTIERFQRLDDVMDGLKARATGLKNQLAKAFLPFVEKATARVTSFLEKNSGDISSFIQHAANLIGRPFLLLSQFIDKGVEWVSGLDTIAKGFAYVAAGAVGLAVALALPAGPLIVLSLIIAAVAEDIYRFLNGQSSLLGKVIKEWDNFVFNLKEVSTEGKGTAKVIASITQSVIDLVAILKESAGVFNFTSDATVSEKLGKGQGVFNKAFNNLNEALTGAPIREVAPATASSKTVAPQITTNITVSGTGDPEETARKVRDAVQQEMVTVIREVQGTVGVLR
jgi:hypothetical protein